jgi:hypothetical protein
MVSITAVLLGGVFALAGVWAAHRLTVVANAALALRGTPTNDRTRLTEGQPVAIEGRVFVDEGRVFDSSVDTVGAYIWHAWFVYASRYTYDFDRGELRQGRNTFAPGLETGRFGVTVGGQTLSVELSWHDEVYDTTDLSELDVGNPKSNARLPTFVARYVWDGMYISLDSTVGDCSMDELTDIVDLYREDAETDEFNVEYTPIWLPTPPGVPNTKGSNSRNLFYFGFRYY